MSLNTSLKQPFPFFLNDDRKNFLLIAGISLFVVFFLGVFSPFQESYPVKFIVAYSIACLLMLSFNIILLPKIFPGWFDNANWDLAKYILFKFFILVTVGAAITGTNIVLRGWESCGPVGLMWLTDQLRVALIGVFPMVAVTLLVKDNLARTNQKSGLEATEKLKLVHDAQEEVIEPIITIQSDTQEQFQVSPHDFLFAEANDNYTEIFWKNGEAVSKKLLRLTLKNLEAQISNNQIIRCHRSYIVNLKSVSEVKGNASGYKLAISDTEKEIPVSRSQGKEILDRINSF